MNTFDNVSAQYKEKAVIQQTAASNLLFIIKIGKSDNIIDIACGPGHISYRLSKITNEKVTGIDISEGMIRQAKNLYPGIDFRQIAAEELDYKNEFDIAFCNSSLMWFVNPEKAIKGIYNALKTGGRLALACPATSDWSPWFGRIISRVTASGDIKPVFSHWKSPWFYLPSKEDYQIFFEKQGFKTEYIEIKHEITDYSIEEAYNIYLSGAGNGFTGKKYYDIEIDDGFVSSFNDHVKEEIRKESTNGRLNVEFNRLYYIGKKATGY
jgi:ubiquinone/menaquinone biosynthesis C-methylase UbiE